MFTDKQMTPQEIRTRFAVGQRVQAHPATDTWMRGDRFGVVVAVGLKRLQVKMDRSGRRVNFRPANLVHLDGSEII